MWIVCDDSVLHRVLSEQGEIRYGNVTIGWLSEESHRIGTLTMQQKVRDCLILGILGE